MAGLVTITCPNCPRELQIRIEHIGRKVSCKFCAGVFRVPRHTMFSCPNCLQEGMVRTEYLGRKVHCKFCQHVIRARSKDAIGLTRGDFEIKKLMAALSSREAEVQTLRDRLDDARGELLGLDQKARELTDLRDLGQRTQEWSIVEEDALQDSHPNSSDLSNGTEPDLPLADLDDSEPEIESLTKVESAGMRELDLTKTRLADPGDDVETLREQCSRLRDELDAYRERSERTVITRDQTEILERELQIARADNVRLDSERAEIRQAAENLMMLVHERESTLQELARERDESRSAFDLAESARLTVVEELEAFKQTRAEERSPESGVDQSSGTSETIRLVGIEHSEAIAELEEKNQLLIAEAERLTDAQNALSEALEQTRAERESLRGEFEKSKKVYLEFTTVHDSTYAEKESLVSEISYLRLDHQTTRAENDSLVLDLERLRLNHETTRAENDAIAADLKRLHQTYSELQTSHDTVAKATQQTEFEKKSLVEEISHLKQAAAVTQKSFVEAKETIRESDAEKKTLLANLEQLKRENEAFQVAQDAVSEAMRLAIAEKVSLAAEVERWTQSHAKVTSAFHQSEAEKKPLVAEIERLKTELKEQTELLAQSRPDLVIDPASWPGRGRAAEMALTKLRFQFDASEADRRSLRSRMADNESQVVQANKRMETLTLENIATIRESKARLAEVESEKKDLIERLKEASLSPESRPIPQT